MGKEIVYCEICGDRILEQEFEKGHAITVLNKNYCFNCKDEAVKNITMEDVDDEEMEPQEEQVLPPVRRPAPARSGGTRQIPRKGGGQTRKRFATAPPQAPLKKKPSQVPLLIGGGVGLAITLVLIIIIATSGGDAETPENNNGGKETATNGSGGSGNSTSPEKAEKAWKNLQERIPDLEKNRDYKKILAAIGSTEPAVRGSKYQVELTKLKIEYSRKKREAPAVQAAEEVFAEIKKEIEADPGFIRYEEIRKKLRTASQKAPIGHMISTEILKAKTEYSDRYEGVSTKNYDKLVNEYGLLVRFESKEYQAVKALVDAHFKKPYRSSHAWKNNLMKIYDECEKKLQKR